MQSSMPRVGRDITAEDRRAQILRAALTCIAATGHESVRLRDVAREAKVSIGALQHHFDTRDELIAQTFRQTSEDLLDTWAEQTRADLAPWERIAGLVDSLVRRRSLRQRCVIWIEFAHAAARHDETRTAFRAVYRRWSQIITNAIQDGARAGDFHPILPVPTIVELILEQLDGGILGIASGVGGLDGPRLRRNTLTLAGALLDHTPAE